MGATRKCIVCGWSKDQTDFSYQSSICFECNRTFWKVMKYRHLTTTPKNTQQLSFAL